MPRLSVLALALALAACGSEEVREAGPISPGEAKTLDEAAEMLDQRRLPAEALPTDAPTAPPAEMTGDDAEARR
ncbi:hypothetical protein [Erythrobacter oryzae]|uniref:hypothetical protein n=1 Tax=Erythrobacter oryzae TaxID=3019556 RepID=UPI0025538EB7|nr:hypothetical protein [Erythrobacter sp. COR-2]